MNLYTQMAQCVCFFTRPDWNFTLRSPPNRPLTAGIRIAQAQATAGQFAEAALTAQKIRRPDFNVFSAIARAQATAGQFAEALLTVQKIQDDTIRSAALSSVAQVQAKAHQWKSRPQYGSPLPGA